MKNAKIYYTTDLTKINMSRLKNKQRYITNLQIKPT